MDISGVYIDPKTSDPLLLERFITYIVNYPPAKGIQKEGNFKVAVIGCGLALMTIAWKFVIIVAILAILVGALTDGLS